MSQSVGSIFAAYKESYNEKTRVFERKIFSVGIPMTLSTVLYNLSEFLKTNRLLFHFRKDLVARIFNLKPFFRRSTSSIERQAWPNKLRMALLLSIVPISDS